MNVKCRSCGLLLSIETQPPARSQVFTCPSCKSEFSLDPSSTPIKAPAPVAPQAIPTFQCAASSPSVQNVNHAGTQQVAASTFSTPPPTIIPNVVSTETTLGVRTEPQLPINDRQPGSRLPLRMTVVAACVVIAMIIAGAAFFVGSLLTVRDSVKPATVGPASTLQRPANDSAGFQPSGAVNHPQPNFVTTDTENRSSSNSFEAREVESLRSEKKRLEADIKELERLKEEKRKLEDEIKNLISTRDTMQAWTKVDLVLCNPGHFTVGLVNKPGSPIVMLLEAEGELAVAARFIAQKHGIPDFSMAAELARNLYRKYDPGDSVSDIDRETLDLYWKSEHKLLPVGRDAPIEFVVFRDARTKRGRLGIFEKIDSDNSLVMWSIASSHEIVRPEHVYPGSARKGSADDLDYLLADSEFFDSCLIRVVQTLQSDAGRAVHSFIPTIAVEVQVDVDGLSRGLRDSQQIWLDHSFSLNSAQAESHSLGTVAKYLEDEIIARLSVIPGIRLMEREDMATVIRELPTRDFVIEYLVGRTLQVSARKSTPTFGEMFRESLAAAGVQQLGQLIKVEQFRQACPVSACLIVELKPPISGGMYHVSMRLVDARSGEIIWAEDGERQLAAPGEYYSLQSGEPVQMGFKVPQDQSAAYETQRIFDTGLRDARSPLVLLEKVETDSVSIRPLFSVFSTRVPRSAISSVTRLSDRKSMLEDSDKLRYLVHRVRGAVVPPAGRVTVSGDIATIDLGTRHHIQEGQRFKVLNGVRTNDGVPRARAVDLVATQVDADRCITSIIRNGVWPNEQTISTDDIAVLRSAHLPVVRVPPLIMVTVPPRIATKLRYNLSPARSLQLNKQGSLVAETVRSCLVKGLTNLNISVVDDAEGAQRATSNPVRPSRTLGFNLEGTGSSQRATSNPVRPSSPPTGIVSHEIVGEIALTEIEDVYDFKWQVRLVGSQEVLLTLDTSKLKMNLGK